MKAYRILVILFIIFLITPVALSQEKIGTGIDVYNYLKIGDDSKSMENLDNFLDYIHALYYLEGFLDGVALTQDFMFDTVLPREVLSDSEREKLAQEINLKRINIPEEGISVIQLAMIYKKYAENYPENLNESARACLMDSVMKAYGFK